jgi:thiol-disulfide isomerase/thioredoxin
MTRLKSGLCKKESTMSKRFLWIAALVAGWFAASALAEELNIGDLAPKMAVKEFVKGEPVRQLEKGKTYVVEFWATWCPPCRTSIPHLTELQKHYPDVTFIGISIDNDSKAVKPFVDKIGEKMDYRVAIDAAPGGGKAGGGPMAKTWMEAALQEGIPTAFIVNKEGKIAWIGHPMEMDKPLADIVAGKWDLEAASTQFKREQAPKRKFLALRAKLIEASKSGDPKQMLKVIDQAIAEDPAWEQTLAVPKYLVLASKEADADKAQAYGKRLVETVLKENPEVLTELARSILRAKDAPAPAAKPIQLALAAARRADELTQGKDPGVADTLARAHFLSGDAAKALACQQRAVKLAAGTPLENNPGMQKRLEQYKEAVEKAANQEKKH